MSNQHKPYLPNVRTGYKPEAHSLVSHGKCSGATKLPDPIEDPIVVNNIANAEFDYTERMDVDKDLNVNSQE